jgi:hypothetical protein
MPRATATTTSVSSRADLTTRSVEPKPALTDDDARIITKRYRMRASSRSWPRRSDRRPRSSYARPLEPGIPRGASGYVVRMSMLLTDPTRLLRLEGLAVLVVVLVAYGALGFSWWVFAALALLPDVSMLAYANGPRTGARVYNLVHASIVPLGLALVGFLAASDGALVVGLAWLAHIAADRVLGYGLKRPTSFHDTHLGRIGRGRPGNATHAHDGP